jgi:hypothetical protein
MSGKIPGSFLGDSKDFDDVAQEAPYSDSPEEDM